MNLPKIKPLKIKFTSDGDLICGINNRICRKVDDKEVYPCVRCRKAHQYFKQSN